MSATRLKHLALAGWLVLAGFCLMTALCLRPVGDTFDRVLSQSRNDTPTDRTGKPLSVTYQARWNTGDAKRLYDLPETLVAAFVFSEDRKFYRHHGVDWRARAGALYQNITRRKTVRGASTITEQVVRLINPRPRTLWSKWLEGVEAMLLERRAAKPAILEFYLNQVPFAAQRRGIVQAARYYFNRDPETLSLRETLTLAVLARAPSAYDLYAHPGAVEKPLSRLAAQMAGENLIPPGDFADFTNSTLETAKPSLPVEARHFARYLRLQVNASGRTTLNGALQTQVQDILDQRLKRLSSKHVANAAALVIDHTNGEILAWVNAGATDPATRGGEIDAVLTPRQPGSTLKPFVYAAALEKGWNAATLLNDAPVAEAVGGGLHRFRNYSNTHYGPITLREALGNSLNIPAVLAVNHVGVEPFLDILHRLGFASLTRGASVYDEGLALGNGEVTLFELVRAYAALANRGQTVPLRHAFDISRAAKPNPVFTKETASLIGNILSDPAARALEFGTDSVLNLPVRTAIKTGTSTDYRDAWTIGFNDRYTVGLWMGNLDRTPMKDVTGSTGPALALRSVFQILNAGRDTKGLYLSPSLIARDVCARPAGPSGDCPRRTEYFASEDSAAPPLPPAKSALELVRPTEGLMLARDPRIPASHQKFRFELAGAKDGDLIEWVLNGKSLARTSGPRYLWPVEKGDQTLAVTIHGDDGTVRALHPVRFTVR